MGNRKSKLTFVTFLTVLRLPLVVAFLIGAVIYSRRPSTWLFYLSFACLIASAVTDLFDGLLARRWNVVTKFGGFADPLMGITDDGHMPTTSGKRSPSSSRLLRMLTAGSIT